MIAAKDNHVDLDERIDDLNRRIRALSQYIDDHPDLEFIEYIRALSLHGQLSSRLGRLMRDRQQISGDQADELTTAIHAALDEIAKEWEIEL